jgi:hypothetical protein
LYASRFNTEKPHQLPLTVSRVSFADFAALQNASFCSFRLPAHFVGMLFSKELPGERPGVE